MLFDKLRLHKFSPYIPTYPTPLPIIPIRTYVTTWQEQHFVGCYAAIIHIYKDIVLLCPVTECEFTRKTTLANTFDQAKGRRRLCLWTRCDCNVLDVHVCILG